MFIVAQPGSPPVIGTVGENMVTALGQQPEALQGAFIAIIMGDKYRIFWQI